MRGLWAGCCAVAGADVDVLDELRPLVAGRLGERIERGTIRDDLKLLFRTGLIKDVSARAEQQARGGVKLVYTVVQTDRLIDLGIEGRSVTQQWDTFETFLLEHLGLRVDAVELQGGLTELRQVLANAGYASTKVSYRFQPLGQGEVGLTVCVEPGPLEEVASLSLAGAAALPRAELLGAIATHVGGVHVTSVVEDDRQRLISQYYDRGMINVTVSADSQPVSGVEGAYAVVFTIHEGEVYRLGALKFTGLSLGTQAELLAELQVRPRDVFSRSAIAKAIHRLMNRGTARGTPVEVTPITAVDNTQRTIDLTFQLDPRAVPSAGASAQR